MKVLYLIDTLEGYGAEKSIVQIAMNMEEVIPVFIHLYAGDQLKSVLTNAGITVYSLNISSNYGYKEALKKIPDIINQEKPDLMHSTLFRADMVARELKILFPEIPLIGSLVNNSYSKKRYLHMSLFSRLKLFTTQCRDRFSINKVDYFICNSKAIKKTNMKALGISEEKIKVIYRGRSFEDYLSPKINVLKLKEELNLGNCNVFINVARLIKRKGQLDLLQAFKLVLEQYPDNLLLIAGEGPLRVELEKNIISLHLQNKVFLLGYREDIPELLALSDYFVFPSYYEGLPGALLEAIIAKKPTIVSNIPENRECFNGEEGFFFPPGNVKEMAQKMEEALNFKNWPKQLKSSFSYAEENFQIKNISNKYERFYKKILS